MKRHDISISTLDGGMYGSGGIEAYLSGQLASFTDLTLLLGSSDL